MKIQMASSEIHMRFSIGKIFRLLFIALIVFAFPLTLLAQEKGFMTLIPGVETVGDNCPNLTISKGCGIKLSFLTKALPAGAKFTGANLMLVGEMQVSQTITVTAALSDGKTPIFGEKTPKSEELFPPSSRANWPASPEFVNVASKSNLSSFSFLLQTETTGLGSNWDWKELEPEKVDRSGSRPRLVLEFTIDARPPVVQSDGVPATQSPGPFMPSPAGAQFTSVSVTKFWSYAPAFYNGLVYVVSEGKQLQALHPLGGEPVWSVPSEPLDNPGQHLVVSRAGRLYIVGKEKILVFNLNASPAAEIKPVSNLNPTLAPAVGADGSLYFVNDQEVYGLNPDLQELWKVTLASKNTSRITVGPSGKFVYLTARNEGLVVINAQTGVKLDVKDSGNNDLANGKLTTFHSPVVIQHPDGTEKIYVAANSRKSGESGESGVFQAFDNIEGKITPCYIEGKITPCKEALKGLWGQPINDQTSPETVKNLNEEKSIYVIEDVDGTNNLTAIDWLNFKRRKKPEAREIPAKNLLKGNLVIDNVGNLIVIDTDGQVRFPPEYTGANSEPMKNANRLFFGSDGTLYALNPTNDNNRPLRAIIPRYTLGAGSGKCMTSPTHLWIDGKTDKNLTLYAPGSVLLGDGFTVPTGFTLTIKNQRKDCPDDQESITDSADKADKRTKQGNRL